MKKIAVVTGTRAEYGLLKGLMERIKADKDFQLCTVVTAMHLSPEFGLTYKEIEKDFTIDEPVEILMSSDSPVGISKSMGLGLIGFSEVWQRQRPDLIVLLGDRYESLAAAASAMIARIPIAHLHGGELTLGAVDEAIRHSITKMSYLHFTSTQEYRNRVIQLGEAPERVFSVGALGVQNIKRIKLMDKSKLEESIDFTLDKDFALVTFHPVTLEDGTVQDQFASLLKVLDRQKSIKFIFTKANSDTDGRIINEMIDAYVSAHGDKACAFTSLGLLRYLSALKYCKLVIGNSSSGIIEAPSFHVPTVNIGDRQKGRMSADSVITCSVQEEDIQAAVDKALSPGFMEVCKNCENPYEGKDTANDIMAVIRDYLLGDKIALKKEFYDIKGEQS